MKSHQNNIHWIVLILQCNHTFGIQYTRSIHRVNNNTRKRKYLKSGPCFMHDWVYRSYYAITLKPPPSLLYYELTHFSVLFAVCFGIGSVLWFADILGTKSNISRLAEHNKFIYIALLCSRNLMNRNTIIAKATFATPRQPVACIRIFVNTL